MRLDEDLSRTYLDDVARTLGDLQAVTGVTTTAAVTVDAIRRLRRAWKTGFERGGRSVAGFSNEDVPSPVEGRMATRGFIR
jgi:hypothetical protein